MMKTNVEHQITLSPAFMPLVHTIGYDQTDVFWAHPDRCPGHHVLIYMLHGCMHIYEGEHEYFLGAGELILLKKGIRHWGENKTLPGSAWYYIMFYSVPDQSPLSLPTSFQLLEEAWYHRSTYDVSMLLPKIWKVENVKRIERHLHMMLGQHRSQHILRPYYISLSFATLLYDIFQQSLLQQKVSNADLLVERIKVLLEKHAEEHLSGSRIAEELNRNYRYLSTVFKQQTGMSISHYSLAMKMQKAMLLLREPAYTISDVAKATGFSNLYYFSRMFKKYVGLAPREYIKELSRTHHLNANDVGPFSSL